jgi:hypothetical protein
MKLSFYDKLLRQAPGEPAAAPADPVAPATPAAADPGPDLSFIPADYHTDGKPDLSKFTSAYQELVARDAQRAEAEAAAAALVPEGDYTFALPEDLTFDGLDLPEGFKVDLLTEDETMKPLFGELSGVLKELRAPNDAAGKLLAIFAKHQAVQFSQAVQAQKADMAKLGTPAQVEARVSTIGRIIESRLPAEEAKAVMAMTTNAKALQAIERLIGPSRSTTPTPTPPGAATEGLTPYERLKLANSSGR